MENYSTTNNVNNEFTTTITNAVETTPANLELAKVQSELETTRLELEHLRRSLDTTKVVSADKSEAIKNSVKVLLDQLDADVIADLICNLNTAKEKHIIKSIADKMPNIVKAGVEESINSEAFKTDIGDLDEYIADNYNEGEIVKLIDAKYSWSTIIDIAFRTGSLDSSDVIDHIDTGDVIAEGFKNGNISFDEVMEHFDASDCFQWLDDASELNWDSVKDYVDLDAVKEEIELDTDMVENYINNLDNHSFRNLITNLS